MISLPGTNLTERLIRENGLERQGLTRWAFAPGMAFGSTVQWWGDGGQRERPHEGVDLCLYHDRQGDLRRLHERARLPAMYGGTVVRLCDDFLGRSVMIECDLPGAGMPGPGTLYVMYGHTVPRTDLEVGQRVQEGEVVAYLAPLSEHKAGILPHLHVSLGWAPGAVAYDGLEWDRIPDLMTLLDPVQALRDKPVTVSAQSWRGLLSR
jgi:murein DD-endopeptidase MepM/ murein hydrolase activator NlpD